MNVLDVDGRSRTKVAVVGAGMAGLACAGRLREAGVEIVLYDKSRAAGGRVATRRRDGLVFNHGAQYATARTPAFGDVLRAAAAAGAAAVWDGAGGRNARWTGTPGMSALPRHLGGGVTTGRQVIFLRAAPDGWHVRHEDAGAVRPGVVVDTGGVCDGPFDAVLLALPAPQAAPLLQACGHAFARAAAAVAVDPCWAAMFATPARLDAPDAERIEEGPIAWAACDSSRPGRTPGPACWMLHASGAWSREHLERGAEDAAAMLLAAFSQRLGRAIEATHLSAHRWRFSQTRGALGAACLWDAVGGVGVCGDWCLGARVEDAFTSGRALAAAVSGDPVTGDPVTGDPVTDDRAR